jgi:glycosyltransferase involved in cell wall biosynthesis
VRTAAERDELHARCLLLEKLLTGTHPIWPPGALRAEAALPSPAVAVILPTHNRAGFVAEAIASVQAQTFRDWELIVVDDGSTDDTQAVVAGFLADPRIRYVAIAKANSATARNRGIAETCAPFIAYIDSDNLWYPHFLRRAVDCLATEPGVDLVYGALVTDEHPLDRRRILWSPFDRDALLKSNFIDTNVIVHRRSLVAQFGDWDASLERLLDWDLVLRYTSETPARPLDVLATFYRQCDDERITDRVSSGPAEIAIRGKWFPPRAITRRPRVLYVVWHYPQLSETYVETELRRMRAWGVHIEIWRTMAGVSPYATSVPIHDGTLADAVASARPDILHVHWLNFALEHQAEIVGFGLPVTLRPHGFDVTQHGLNTWLASSDRVKGVYAYPDQIALVGAADARLRPTPVAFDTELFKPRTAKDRRLVVRASAALPSKDLELFLTAARLLPEYRFVLAAVTCNYREEYAAQLRALNEQMGSPVTLMPDLPRAALADLIGEAGIYVHTAHPPSHDEGTPIGQPASIAEAMASGCYCLARDLPELAAMVGDAGATYADLDGLVAAIRATEAWTDAAWNAVRLRAANRAYHNHADVLVYPTLFNDWIDLTTSTEPAASPSITEAGDLARF